MAVLARFDAEGLWQDTWVCDDWITRKLAAHGVVWGRWPVHDVAGGSADAARAAYRREIAGLQHLCDVQSATWAPTLVDGEHRLGASEIRFFVEGAGLLYLRDGAHRLGLLCDAGEWVVLPAGLPLVFDAGTAQALRLSEGPATLAVQATGSAAPPPLTCDAFVEQVLEWTGDVDA